jgi:hypothetical protein
MVERTVWTRLEPRAKSEKMDDALRAPVRDPMWMLSRQWQVSEFTGEDAGSPVSVDLSIAEDDLSRVDLRGGGRGPETGPASPFDYEGGPLEAIVEREEVMTDDDGPPLRLRAEAGQQFLRRLTEAGYGEYSAADFPDALVLESPDEAMEAADRRYVELMAGRTLDGTEVARAIRSAVGNIDAIVAGDADSWSGVSASKLPVPGGGSRTATFDECVEDFYGWYVDLYDEPTTETGSAWDPTRLEYRFAVSTGQGKTETVFRAPSYLGGSLGWHAFSTADASATLASGTTTSTDGGRDTSSTGQSTGGGSSGSTGGSGGSGGSGGGQSSGESASSGGGNKQSSGATEPGSFPDDHPTSVREKSVMPTQITFPGMPAPRWWEFEDGDTDLSQVTGDGATISQLTLVEFATQYGNDWFQIPVETPVGSLTRITDLTVTDAFGVTETATAAMDEEWQLFMHDLPGHEEPGLFVPPTLSDSVTGDPVEKVVFARDEMANLAFAIERIIESPTGRAVDRTEFQQPRLVVDRVSAAEDPDEESIQLANPGEDRLVVDGYEIRADMGDQTRTVYTLGERTLGPGETLELVTGTDGEEATLSAGLSTSVWTNAEAAQVANDSGRVVAKQLLVRPSDALADYRLSTDVPEYWFPFTPEDGTDERRLERALLLDAESLGLPLESIPRPLGEILRPETKLLPAGEDTYQVYDAEVPRNGREVTRKYQFARWTDGGSHLWSSRESRVDDTQLSSGLRFDVLEERE